MTAGHHNNQQCIYIVLQITRGIVAMTYHYYIVYVVNDEIYINLVISVYPPTYILHPKNTPEPHRFSRLGCPRRV